MAHFAELESKTDPTGFTSDTHLVVKQVTVVGNDISAGGGTLEDNDMHYKQMNKILEDGQWYSGFASKTSDKYHDGYPIYFDVDDVLYLQTLEKYNMPKRKNDWEPAALSKMPCATYQRNLFSRLTVIS